MRTWTRAAAIAAGCLMAAGLTAGAGTPLASAQPGEIVFHLGQIGKPYCRNDVCAEALFSPSGNMGTVRIKVWAPAFTFYGHFELQTPAHRTLNSHDTTNFRNHTAPIWLVPNDNGTFIASAWEKAGGRSYTGIGSIHFGGLFL